MPDILFYNAQVITMDDSLPQAQAVLIRDGKIAAAGANDALLSQAGPDTILRDLQGKALLPGFIDPHSHITSVAQSLLMVNARPSPSGPCDTRELLLAQFRKACAGVSPGEWLLGMGYDPTVFPDQTGITRLDLDAISRTVPICCIHVSGHMAVLNTPGLQKLGYWVRYAIPAGGTVELLPDGTPSGLITEQAYLSPEIQARIPSADPEKMNAALAEASHLYASFGITTAQDARVNVREHSLLAAGGRSGAIAIDVVGIAAADAAGQLLAHPASSVVYHDHIRMGGYKIFLDGSPQGKTAWLSQSYFRPPEGQDHHYRGFPLLDDEQVTAAAKTCLKHGWQLNAHCNGDEACHQLIRCYDAAIRETGICRDLRPVMIHAQSVRADQLEAMARLGIRASFFLDHVYYWGDWHRSSVFGPERAEHISPIRWALDRGVPSTLHQDAPVVPPNVLLSVHNAVNRKTMSGTVLGPEQRIRVEEALRAVTLSGACQIFEESSKGSITPGKRADLVILGENPLTADPARLRDIPVLETIKDGVSIFRREP